MWRFDATCLQILHSSLSRKCWRSFFWLQSIWCKVFDLIFFVQSWAALSIYYSVSAHVARTLWASTVTRYNYLCQFFNSCFVDLTLVIVVNSRGNGSTIIVRQRKVPIFTPSIFSIPWLLPALSLIYSAFVACWIIFCFIAVWWMRVGINSQLSSILAFSKDPVPIDKAGISEQIKPLQPVGQAAEIKFESKCQPLPVIWQSLQKAIPENNRRILLQNQWPSSLGWAQALLWRVGRENASSVRFQVSGSCWWKLQAPLWKNCYHSCNTDLVQES